MRYITSFGFLLCFCFLGVQALQAQESISDSSLSKSSKKGKSALPTVRAIRIEEPDAFTFDGKLNDPIWGRAPVATNFIQREPNDGKPASERTEAMIIYTDQALYVGIKAYDSSRDSIAATLFRKDGEAYSDWVYVNIDSYNDNRTSFSFAVNPKGVRKDVLTYNDDNEDIRWDAVWEAKTDIQDDGWTVEMKIPLSQLRFNANGSTQTWGINFQRRIARKEEIAFWSPTPQSAAGFVSRYGELVGIKNLEEPNRLEIAPYASTNLTRAPGESSNPFYNANDLSGSLGADIKYGLTSDFTLTATVNPDFGQVEADPAIINLTAYETFFEEQRPFFLEGTDIFQFGRTQTFNTYGNPLVFYSRRIGRQPAGLVSAAGIDADYVDAPDQTTIASAAKVSGKTQNGLSVGILNAFTTRENATYITPGNEEGSISIEPPSNYFVGRIKQDFDGGATVIGGYASAVNRFIGADYLESSLHKSAYVAGLDFEHSWNDRDWVLSGVVSGTQVNGTTEAIAQTQNSSARYYGRVDADYLSLDPDKTSLSGYAGELSLVRYGGEHWRGSLTYSVVSPGYEVNDLGFENRADYHATSYLVQYRETSPEAPFRFYNFNLYANHAWNYGGERIFNGYGFSSNFEFSNLWSVNLNAGYNGSSYDDRLLRGGPLALSPTSYYYSGVISTDNSRKISFTVGHLRSQSSETEGFERDVFLDMTIRPTSYIQITVSPNYNFQKDTDQYIRVVSDPTATETYQKRYVFSDISRKTLSTSFRLDWTFTPDMSLQTYVRPFITSGDFYNYKEFTTPREYDFAVYGQDRGTISDDNGIFTVDPDAAGPAEAFSFAERDFNFRSIQTNAVFRWEYKPGATLYLVWQQERSASAQLDNFRLSRDLNGLFDTEPTNVFLVKLSYWFGT
jgi:hypothetical protein